MPIHWYALLALAPFLSRALAMASPIDPLLCASDQVNFILPMINQASMI